MNGVFKDFVKKIINDEKFRNKFKKCKNLKESYDKFMQKKCTYEEYKNFCKDFMQKVTPLSDKDLEQVAGGLSFRKMLAPLTIVTLITGFGALSASASGGAPPSENSAQTSSQSTTTSAQTVAKNSTNPADQLPECEITGGGNNTFVAGSFDEIDDSKPMKKFVVNNHQEISDNATIAVLSGVKHIKLKGNVKLEFYENYPSQVESIDASDSSKYIVEYDQKIIKLYNKLPDGSKGELENITMPHSSTDEYDFYFNTEKKVANITFNSTKVDISKIPACILRLENLNINLNIKIGLGVESLVMDKEHRVDLSTATNLKNVDTNNSSIYTKDKDEIAIYEKAEDGQKKLAKILATKKTMNNFTVEYSAKDEQFLVYNDQEEPQDIIIPESLENTNKRIKIGKGIKSLTVDSKINLDLSQACDLEDMKDSSGLGTYLIENNILYKIIHKDTEKIKTPIKPLKSESNMRHRLNFSIEESNDRTNPKKFISISKNDANLSNLENVKIPDYILDFNKKHLGNAPFKVKSGIQSVILQGDERLDLTDANDLIYVDTTNSSVYCLDSYGVALYEKATDGGNDKPVKLLKQYGVIKGIKFNFDNSLKYWYLSGDKYIQTSQNYDLLKNVEIPDGLRKFCNNFYIMPGIESIILKDNERISGIGTYSNLKDINVEKSNVYVKDKDGIMLYEKVTDSNGNIKKQRQTIQKQNGNINGMEFSIIYDNDKKIYKGFLSSGDQNKLLDNVEIPESLREACDLVFINSGIKSIILGENDVVDLTGAHDLESINASKSKIYEMKNFDGFDNLCEKKPNNNPNAPEKIVGFCRKIKTIGKAKCCMAPHRKVFVKSTDPNSHVKNFDLDIKKLYGPGLYSYFKDDPNNEFIIGPGIESIILKGDDRVNLNEAHDLKDVNLKQSKIYSQDKNKIAIWEDIKDNNGNINKQFIKVLTPSGKIGNINFFANQFQNYIFFSNNDKDNLLDNFQIPNDLDEFKKIGVVFSIGPGIKSVILGQNESVDLNMATDLEHINAKNSNIYTTDANGVALYIARMPYIPYMPYNTIKKINGANIFYNSADLSITIQNFNSDSPLKNFKIPDCLKNICKLFKIGQGIESISDLSNENINIDDALDLKSISLKNDGNCIYEIKDGNLKNKINNTDLGKINKSVIYDFCFDRMKEFDKDDKKFTELPKIENLNKNMKYSVKEPDGSTKSYTIDEQATYKNIEQVVKDLIEKVEKRTPSKEKSTEEIEKGFATYEGEGINRIKTSKGIYSRHYKMNTKWRIAKAIYRWVAKNIKYDQDSLVPNCRKSQDPFFVFNQKTGVCAGKAMLTALMMRMAGIPSGVIGTLAEPNQQFTHAYTAIYLENNEGGYYNDSNKLVDNKKAAGWALIDATWGAPDSSQDPTNSSNNQSTSMANANTSLSGNNATKIKNYFSGFYDNKPLKNSNQNLLHQQHHIFLNLVELSDNPSSQIYGLLNNFGDENSEIKFSLNNNTHSPSMLICGKEGGTQKEFKIPKSLLKYDYPITIGGGIGQMRLSDKEVEKINFSSECKIKKLNLSDKNSKYITNDFAIYEKDAHGKKGKLLKIFNNDIVTAANGIKYRIFSNFIGLIGNDGKDGGKKITHLDIQKLPQDLKDLNRPFWITGGFETIDVPSDFDLDNLLFYSDNSAQTINIPDKFKWRGTSYDKPQHKPSTPKELMTLKPGLTYRLNFSGIVLTGNDKNIKSLNIEKDIPSSLKNLKINFAISSGFDSIICPESKINNITFQNNSNVKNIDIISGSNLSSYTKDGVALYKDDKLVYIYNKGTNIAENGLKYQICNNFIKVDASDTKKELDMSKDIPDNLKKIDLPLLIGENFEKVTLDDSKKVLFDSKCKLNNTTLKLADKSKKYMIKEDGLYVKNDDQDKNFECQLLSFNKSYNTLPSGVKYQIYPGFIRLMGDGKNKKSLDIDQDIPLYLSDTKMTFKISKGFDSVKNMGNHNINFLNDSHVKDVDIAKNSFWTKDDVAIYKYGELISTYNRGINTTEGGIKYQISDNFITLNATEDKKDLDILKDIPDNLKNLNLPFKIGIGFEKMTLNDSDNVIFDKDCGLNNKNLILNGSSKKYVIEKDGLHEKGSDGKTGQMVFKFKTDAK